VVSGGSVFVTTALGSGHERALLRLDAATGALRWSRTVARSRDLESLHSEHSHASSTPATDGSLVLAGGRLYATDDTGVTTVFEASPERYLQVARNEIGELVYATPAVADGRLFIRTKRRLHALGECAAAASPPSLGRAGGPGSTQ
jgi:outer membrane protein assembly factor BamB